MRTQSPLEPTNYSTLYSALESWRWAWRAVHGVRNLESRKHSPCVNASFAAGHPQLAAVKKLVQEFNSYLLPMIPPGTYVTANFDPAATLVHIPARIRLDWQALIQSAPPVPMREAEKEFALTGAELQGLGVTGAGLKLDHGKLEMWEFVSVFKRAFAALAQHAQKGTKVGNRGWGDQRIVPDGERRYRNGLARHFFAENFEPGSRDSDGDEHLVALAWNAMELLERRETDKAQDVTSNVRGIQQAAAIGNSAALVARDALRDALKKHFAEGGASSVAEPGLGAKIAERNAVIAAEHAVQREAAVVEKRNAAWAAEMAAAGEAKYGAIDRVSVPFQAPRDV